MPGEPKSGRSAAVIHALLKARVFLVAAALIAGVVALYSLYLTDAEYFPVVVRAFGPAIVVWAAGIFVLLLSARLTLIAALAPLLAWLWWIAAVAALNLWTADTAYDVFAVISLAIVVVGALIAALQMNIMAVELARGKEVNAAVRLALTRSIVPSVLGLLAASAGIVALGFPDLSILPVIGVGVATTFVASFLLPPLAASLFPASEAFIARFNRAREWRERFISIFAIFSIPRWALSTIGMAGVLSAIIYFDGTFSPLWKETGQRCAAVSVAIGLLGAVAVRDWRYFFSCGLSVFAATLIGGWLALRLGADIDYIGDASLLLGSGAGALLIYILAGPMSAHRRAGEPMMIACSRALDEMGPVIFVLAIALSLAMLTAAISNQISLAIAVLPLVQLAGALITLPALAAALDDLFPRRRSVEELYRAR